MNSSMMKLYGVAGSADLSQFLNSMDYPRTGLYKCRITYDDHSKMAEFLPYTFKPITSLKLVENDTILYEHKYADRSLINQLTERKGDCDDILIVKRGLVTDSSYANIVFRRGGKWYTPASYLLKGTMRENLLQSGRIIEKEIGVKDIANFEKFKLINAMLGFEGQECDISNIF